MPHESHKVLQTLVYSLAKLLKCYTMKLQAFPKVQPLLMTEKLQDIGNQQLILDSRGRAHKFRICSNKF